MKSVLVTGGSGAFGTAFVRHLLEYSDVERIVVFSRGEFRQFTMAAELATLDRGQLRMMIGDVRDKDRLKRAMRGIDVCVHAAALKRIEVAAYNPDELIKTNILGSLNVVEAAMDTGVKKAVLLSSDKAWQPISPYGHSKAMAESLFTTANNIRGWNGPLYACTRYGNVWRSTGSVVPIWEKLLAEGADTVPVTNPACSRFYMTMPQAVAFVLRTIETMKGGEIDIPTLPAYRLSDLAEAMGAKMNIIGLPTWEKTHEGMSDTLRSDTARQLTVDELRFALRSVQ